METAPGSPPPSPRVIAAVYVGGFAVLVGSYYAFDAAVEALVVTPMCRGECGGHRGLARVEVTHHGKSTHCVCACNDGAAIRSTAGETASGLAPLMMMVFACVVAFAAIWVRQRVRRGRDARP